MVRILSVCTIFGLSLLLARTTSMAGGIPKKATSPEGVYFQTGDDKYILDLVKGKYTWKKMRF